MSLTRFIRVMVVLGALAAVVQAQQKPTELFSQDVPATAVDLSGNSAPGNPDGASRSAYVVGPGDVIMISAVDFDEAANKSLQIDGQGNLNVPMLGRIRVAGMRIDELEKDLDARLKVFIREPNVAVSVQEYRSQPVTVVGAVNRPGVHQLQGQKTLLEVISMAEGMRQDAGFSAQVTRRLEYGEVPLPNAQVDRSERFSVAQVDLEKLLAGKSPEQNIVMMPNDVISIPRAHMVYVVGAVERAGGFALAEQANISVLQALALAGGMNPTAAPGSARILRPGEDDNGRVEIAVNLKDILTGKIPDMPMGGDDILFVPNSRMKQVGSMVGQAAVNAVSNIAVWRIGRSGGY